MRGSSCHGIQPGQGVVWFYASEYVGTHSLPNIRVFTRPGTKGLELAFWLAHPCAEEVEFSQSLCTGPGVTVYWVKSIRRISEDGREKVR